ncbi:MAG: nitronate monooxygenase [Deltaproteobacteria bacterium]|nr:nitronate monooxygenase [Deltaproteobacteria bacterium]
MLNPLCQTLGIRYPILLGGLLNIGKAPLVSAVSDAGGLGILGAGRWAKDELRDQIRQGKSLTNRPFGVNIVVRSPHSISQVDVVIEEKIRVVTTSAGDPKRYTARLKENGIYVMQVVPTVEFALRAQDAGVDAIIAEGSESGGFTSLEEVSSLVLIPQVVDAVSCPVLAAGGIGDGRALAAALTLGAVGVQLGTRFLATNECEIPDAYKKALIAAKDTDTVLARSGRAAHRDLKKTLIESVLAHSEPNSKSGYPRSDQENGLTWENHLQMEKAIPTWSAGQVAGLIGEIIPVKDLIELIIHDAWGTLSRLSKGREWLDNK